MNVIFFLVQKSPLFYEHAPQLDLAVDARYLPDVHITHFQKMSLSLSDHKRHMFTSLDPARPIS